MFVLWKGKVIYVLSALDSDSVKMNDSQIFDFATLKYRGRETLYGAPWLRLFYRSDKLDFATLEYPGRHCFGATWRPFPHTKY